MAKTSFSGEYPVTLDNKGRFLFPALLKTQVPAKTKNEFRILRGIDRCLVMYTLHDWNILQDAVRGLSQFDQRSLDAMRYLISGAIPSKIDATNRVLIPKQLMSYAGLKKDVMINAFLNRIEIWDEKEYERTRKRNLEKNKASAQKVLASIQIPW